MTPMTSRFLVVAAVCSLVAGSCTGGTDGPARTSPAPSGAAIVVATGAPIPTTVSDLPAVDVGGFHDLLDRAKGTPLVVNFWASWCEPCTREAPMLARAARTHRDIQFLGVNILDSKDGALQFVADHDVPYPSLFDPAGDIRTDLGSLGQPVTVFYTAGGAQVAKIDGELSHGVLRSNLALIEP
jgi:cytochrome c biogenesis protein CcmG, thiol:disulfide interchange protein DsbE